MADPSFDVLLIGGGAGGGTAAWYLADHGLRVGLIDAGPRFDPVSDSRLAEPDWEQRGFPHTRRSRGRYSFGFLQRLTEENADLFSWNHISGRRNRAEYRAGGSYQHVRGIGGSTLHFTGEAHRLNPAAMSLFTRYGVAADWPVSYTELEPFYELAEHTVGVAGSPRDISRPRREAFPLPAHEPSYASQVLMRAGARAGVTWVPNPLAVLSQPYHRRPPCNHCGNCSRLCPRQDLGTVATTFIRDAETSKRCDVKANITALAILGDAGRDRVTGVLCADADGNRFTLTGRVVVIACGAIETPRLLLNSTAPHSPDGFGNESGLIGQNFMESIWWYSAGIHPESIGSHRGHPVDIVAWDYNGPDKIPGTIGGARFVPMTLQAGFVGPISYATRVVAGFGSEHAKEMHELFGRVLAVGGMAESLPNPRSFIDIDPDSTDESGLPLARINSFLPDSEIARIRFLANKSRQILDHAGVPKVFEEFGVYDTFSSSHVFGTARMGTDPERSVVNPYGRSHRWRNLYIADASVFPSSGGGEAPSLTIEALALRTASKICDELSAREL